MKIPVVFIIILLLPVCITTCAVYNVIPDDHNYYYFNITCHHCHTLQYYHLNTTKYFTSNSQLFFFPGLHHLHSDLTIENVQNISFIGANISYSNRSVIIDCSLLAGFVLRNITNLIIENIMIKDCQTQHFSAYGYPDVVIIECDFIKLNHVKIYHKIDTKLHKTSLLGFNIIGNSSLDHVICDMRLSLYYNETNMSWPTKDHVIISLNHYKIKQNFQPLAIELNQLSYTFTLKVSNTVIRDTFLDIRSSNPFREKCSTLIITNCQFKDLGSLFSHNVGFVYFMSCEFIVNYKENQYGLKISNSEKVIFSHCVFHDSPFFGLAFSSSMIFKHCKFNHNKFGYIFRENNHHVQIKPINIVIENTSFNASKIKNSLMSFAHTNVLLIGPVKFHGITSKLADQGSIIKLLNCTVSIYGYVEFSRNTVITLIEFVCITKECFTVNVADNSTLIVSDNRVGTYFFSEWPNNYSVNAQKFKPCFFQYLSDTICNGQNNYSIKFNRNVHGFLEVMLITFRSKFEYTATNYGLLPLTHCYWLQHSTFTTATIPLDVNKKYVKFANNSKGLPTIKNEKLLCYCNNDTHYDCYKDNLGYLYPGQTAAVPLCYPLADRYADNAEVIVNANFNQTHFTPCVVYKINETVQMINKKCTTFHYTIAFLTNGWCELFLKVPFNRQMEYSVFYVRELLCPLGFSKRDGLCQCYPLFNLFGITDCDINKQAVLRPADGWIYALNYNEYVISKQCPFHYCKTSASYLNLSTPEVQCQFSRSGILCGQCQHGLSTVFSTSHCQYCSNTYVLLIIPIAIAGFVLVLLLFLLNLTVTDGTINAFILYVNIISVNNTNFFPSNPSQQTAVVYVLISVANLDLGIKTCFYNGMDDYAKMWLQLGFPIYLILIATLLIIASRYSSIIQKLTSHRALSVLATLFLLSYTKILRTVCDVLFLYSSVTHLPSKRTTLVWSLDANVPLFGVQFTLLFVVCLILFVILITFNIILLFTRTLSRFNCINKFKPLLDAYQGAYKIKFYYWTGLQLVMRTVFFGLSSLDSNINLPISITILSITNVVHACSKPFKSKIKNYQELLLILNLLVLYTFAVSSAVNDINAIAVNIMITIAFTQFSLIVVYHIIAYGCSGVIKTRLLSLCHDVLTVWISKSDKKSQDRQFELHHCNVPEVTYNYHEYQEPLIGQEYCQ